MTDLSVVLGVTVDPQLVQGAIGVFILLGVMFALAFFAVWYGQRKQVKKTIQTFGLEKAADVGADSDWWSEAGAAVAEDSNVVPPWMEEVLATPAPKKATGRPSNQPIYTDTPAPAPVPDPDDWSAPPPPKVEVPKPAAPAPQVFTPPASASPAAPTMPSPEAAAPYTPPAPAPAPAPTPPAPAARTRVVPSTFGAPIKPKTDDK